MKRDDWISGPFGVRPAGRPTECFYCKAPVGEQHAKDCVIRERTVVVRATVEYTINVPEDWDAHLIEFSRNESSSCANNVVEEIERLVERLDKAHRCVCGMVTTKYIREATADDEETSLLFVKDLPS